MSQDLMQFDDPNLKTAIKRVWGGHQAPPELRAQLQQMLITGQEQPAETQTKPLNPSLQSRWYLARRISLAACVLIAIIAAAAYYTHVYHDREEYEEYVEANHDLFAGMVALQLTSLTTPGAEKLSFAAGAKAVSADVSNRVGRTIPTPDMSADGWALRDVSLCPFRGSTAVKCEFEKGNGNYTLLSIPASLVAGADEVESYELTEQGHPIAGYIKGASLNCLIGDAGASLPETIALRDHLRSF